MAAYNDLLDAKIKYERIRVLDEEFGRFYCQEVDNHVEDATWHTTMHELIDQFAKLKEQAYNEREQAYMTNLRSERMTE